MAKPSVNRALQDAQSLTRRGAYAEARALYRAILAEFPDNLPARQALRALDRAHPGPLTAHPPRETLAALAAACGRGQFAQVARDCQALLAAFPTSFLAWNLQGVALQSLGRTAPAMDSFLRASELSPEYAEARYNLGVLLQVAGKLDAADTAYRAAVALKPDHVQALNNLGFLALSRGRASVAVDWLNRALALRPDFAEAQNNLGSALARLNRPEAALAAFARAVALKPGLVAAQVNIGNLHLEQGRQAQAVAAFEAALRIAPTHVEALDALGTALRLSGRADEAIAAHRRALELAPDRPDALFSLGQALKRAGRVEEAIAAYEAALARAPDHARAANALGIALQDLGRIDAAAAAYRRALAIQPDFAECSLNLARAVPLSPDDPQVQAMVRQIRASETSEADRATLGFALATVHDQNGDTGTAFRHLSQANALKRRLLAYDPEDDRRLFAAIATAAPRIAQAGQGIAPDLAARPAPVTPIFILGMPRSGTTLIEQVISAHPDVTGAGELDLCARLGEDLATGRRPAHAGALAEFRRAYLDEAVNPAEGRPWITDKTPQNFLFLALIAAALPEARIVHVTRDPAATCWSNYWQDFASRRIGYAYDLDDTRAYYRDYRTWMAAFESLHPGRLIGMNYEALTEAPEAMTRSLIAALGLGWSDACLTPQENRRAVRTASNLQVRQAIYQGSSQKWRAYAPYLGGALDGLAPG